jgi:hypothetical protein
MSHTMKIVAVGAMTLVGAMLTLAAPALGAEFSAEATWSGQGEHQVFQLGATPPNICETVNLTGVSPKATVSATAVMKPKYEGCQYKLLEIRETVEVSTHECEYELSNAKGTSKVEGEASLVNCPTGIELKYSNGCEVVIPEQTSSAPSLLANLKTEAGAFESEVTAGLAGFKYTASEKCANLGIKSGKEGDYEGSARVKGLIMVSAEVTATPKEVKFGNAEKASGTVAYTNKGSSPWVVGSLAYTVKTGSSKAVEVKNGCAGLKLATGEKCSVALTYTASPPEAYKAEMKLGNEAPVVTVKAEA